MRSACDTSGASKDVEMFKKLPQSPNTSMMTKDSSQENCSRNTSGSVGSPQKNEVSESSSSKDAHINVGSLSSRPPHSHSQSNNERSFHGDMEDSEENPSSRNQAEQSEVPTERVEHSSLGSVVNNSVGDQKSHARDSVIIIQNNQENTLQSQTSEGSDIVEDDVKVCDICGDAGREDLLAICSRCSDGAEHTYCMRVMLDKVPEGDWLCEECQFKEDAEKQKLDKTKSVATTSKEPPLKEKGSGGTLNSKLSPKLDIKEDEVEANKGLKVTVGALLPAKRHADYIEDSQKSRKMALETTAGAPGLGSPRKKPALSRESSFKIIDVGKAKQGNLTPSSGSQSLANSKEFSRLSSMTGSDSSRIQALQSSRGLLARSATFNSLTSKPKVKQLVEDAFQKQKLTRESSSGITRKEGLGTKSMSFRTPSVRSNVVESKTKVLSSSLLRGEDSRGFKQAKEQSILERKNSIKLDRHVASSSTGTPQREGKVDLFNKGSERGLVLDGCGEVKKQSSCLSSSFGVSVSKGKPNLERKSNQIGTKEDVAPIIVSDESWGNQDVLVPDGLPLFQESRKQEGKTKDCKQAVTKSIRCRRCNEFGHSAQFCTASNLRFSTLRAPSARSSGESNNKSTKWKDAIEAISRTRPKDARSPDQSDDLSVSSAELSGDIASKDQILNSANCAKNLSSVEGATDDQEALRCSTADSSRTMSSAHVKQNSLHSRESSREAIANANCDEVKVNSVMKMSSQVSGIANLSRMSAIPELNYIWQGSFEVQRNGRLPDYFDGIQAHMSTCASRKVLEVVKKFPCKVQMEEVPRLSSWPAQFQGTAKEDNIALYFFAKDIESYEGNYRKLLDNMLKNDLALKGNIDRIELLIFPSNQLPEKSQRWNRLYFLWAVFREMRVTCSESVPAYSKKPKVANLDKESSVQAPCTSDVKTVIKTDSCEETNEKLPMCGSPEKVMDLPFLSSSQRVDGNDDRKIPSLDQRPISFDKQAPTTFDDVVLSEKQAGSSIPEINSSATASHLTRSLEDCSLSSKPITHAQICPEVKVDCILLKEGYCDSKSERDTQLQFCSQSTAMQNGPNKGKLVISDLDNSDSKCLELISGATISQVSSSLSAKIVPVSSSSFSEETSPKERSRLMDTTVLQAVDRWKEITEKDHGCLKSKSGLKHPSIGLSDPISATTSELSKEPIQVAVWKEKSCSEVGGEKNSKKMKSFRDLNLQSNDQEQTYEDGFSSKILGLDASREQNGAYACNSNAARTIENCVTTEKYLFPVDSGHVKDLRSGNTIPWQILSSDDEDVHEVDAPNLELALGAEKKQPKQGGLPLFGKIVGENTKQSKLLGPAIDDGGDDLSASLSLSLSFPFPEKGQTAKPVSKAEQVLPKRQHVNTSLLLFGGSLTDT